ncbi:MAG: NrsF family protein [Bryobacteraceae bacterium]
MNRTDIDRVLLEKLSAQSTGCELRPELTKAIAEGIGRNLSAVRPLRPFGYYAAGFALIFLAPIVAALGMLSTNGIAGMSTAAIVIAFGALVVCAALLAVSLAADMSPGSRRPAPSVVLTGGILLSLAAMFCVLLPYHTETSFWVPSGNCLQLGVVFAVPTAALAWGLLRRGAVLSPAISGAAAGLLGGLAGLTVLEIHCPDHNLAHVLVAHWGAALVCTAIGLVAGASMEERARRA